MQRERERRKEELRSWEDPSSPHTAAEQGEVKLEQGGAR